MLEAEIEISCVSVHPKTQVRLLPSVIVIILILQSRDDLTQIVTAKKVFVLLTALEIMGQGFLDHRDEDICLGSCS